MSTIKVGVPTDYDLPRDACSYGYFVLAPNYWDVKAKALWRVIDLGPRAVLAKATQPKGRGSPLALWTAEKLTEPEAAALRTQLSRMLRLDEDASHIAQFHTLDPRFAPVGKGRLFRSPTLFEDVIKTVTSCNVTWPSTMQMNRRLCEVLGKKAATPNNAPQAHAFPTPAKLARAKATTLRARCRVGYRDARMIALAKLFTLPPSKGGIDEAWLANPATPDDAVFKSLIELPGIGPYAAANIMQLLGRYSRLPLDTESVRHGKTVLGMKGSSAQIMRRVKKHFAPFGDHAFRSYWFELWELYERKHGPSHTWERDHTGKLFTAAALNK
ncbi:MAG: hypothetical protein WC718_04965 [Phycisphaerales bacterium]|jgi:3-methyladenine DNA glycosylase/8-oxoguanine DNA glycosylase